MYTPAIQPRFVRTELVVQKQEDKNIENVIVLHNNVKLIQVKTRNLVQMNEQETEVFFSVCENVSTSPMELFSHFGTVSKWFHD